MRPTIKLAYSDFWAGFSPEQNLLTNLLRKHFNIQLSDSDPDLLIYSCYGFNFLNYKCHRIFYTAENVRPDFRECDHSLSFDYDEYEGKNTRVPLYLFTYLKYLTKGNELPIASTPKTKFCNMVVSNPKGQERNSFFEVLNQYKQVDSGGKYKNNTGGPVEDKLEFISQYRFTIAFENSSFPGYTTEKLVQPMLVGSIPIYWGNPRIHEEFNTKSFINVHAYDSFEKVVSEITLIEENPDIYNEMIKQPWLINNQPHENQDYELLGEKLNNIVNRILNEHPVAAQNALYSISKKIRKKVINKITKKPIWYI